MSLHRFIITYPTWIISVILQVVIVTTILRRRMYREFPLFLCYTLSQIIFAVAGILISLLPDSYYRLFFYVSWVGKGAEVALSFAVIYEIFSHVFHSYDALQRLGSLLFRWCLVVLLMLAVVTAASEVGSDASRLISAILLLQRSLSVVQCGLLFFLFLFASYFGVVWRHYVVGITLGFGIFGTMRLGLTRSML